MEKLRKVSSLIQRKRIDEAMNLSQVDAMQLQKLELENSLRISTSLSVKKELNKMRKRTDRRQNNSCQMDESFIKKFEKKYLID